MMANYACGFPVVMPAVAAAGAEFVWFSGVFDIRTIFQFPLKFACAICMHSVFLHFPILHQFYRQMPLVIVTVWSILLCVLCNSKRRINIQFGEFVCTLEILRRNYHSILFGWEV